MLNHIWLALIVIGILTAGGRDIHDAVTNAYGNHAIITVRPGSDIPRDRVVRTDVPLTFDAASFRAQAPAFSCSGTEFTVPAGITMHNGSDGRFTLTVTGDAPAFLQTLADAQGGKKSVSGRVFVRDVNGQAVWSVMFDPVSFVMMRRITMAAIEAAGTAVEIAIGLIGIMALWLGMMAIAEKAGIVGIIARAVRPVMSRLFPDLPHDHPAIAAIVMNISANMLGLGNAATPFGLKAMEELNKVNPKAGVASNEMVTFLAMNTSCITLIPATAIAVRAAAGSSDPAIIIGTTLLASLTATIVAIATAKTLQRLRMFRIDRAEAR